MSLGSTKIVHDYTNDECNFSFIQLNRFFFKGLGLVGGKHRVFASTLLSGFYPVGEALVGLLFWYIRDWRTFLIIMNLPGLCFAFVYK